MKKTYKQPTIESIEFVSSTIIATSLPTGDGGDIKIPVGKDEEFGETGTNKFENDWDFNWD